MLPTSYVTATFPVLSATLSGISTKSYQPSKQIPQVFVGSRLPTGSRNICYRRGAIIPTFYGPAFEQSIGASRILSWYLPLIFCNMLLWRVLMVRGEQRVVFRVQLINEIGPSLLAVGLTPSIWMSWRGLGVVRRHADLCRVVCVLCPAQ